MSELEEKDLNAVPEQAEPEAPALSEDLTEEDLLPEAKQPAEPYTPRPLGFRIFALVLAILVIIGLVLYYYNIFTAGR